MSKKKKHQGIAKRRNAIQSAITAQLEKRKPESTEEGGVEVKVQPGKPRMVPYDATKHKGYVLMYKKNSPDSTRWIPPGEVKAYRGNGWKTDAEVRKIYAKWLRKHPEEAAKMKAEMEQNLKGINCPLCNGSTKIWVQCCLPGTEDGCGCNHLPVMNDCYICQGTGKVDPQVAELLVSDYLVGLRNEQVELDEFMQAKEPTEI